MRTVTGLSLVLVWGAAAQQAEPHTYRVAEKAHPWHDRVGIWRMVDVPPELTGDVDVPRQACADRGVIIPDGSAVAVLGMNAQDLREARRRKLPIRETDLQFHIQAPEGGKKLIYYVVLYDDPPRKVALGGGAGMILLGLNDNGIPARATPVTLIDPSAGPPKRPAIEPEPKTRAQRESFHLYLLIGQSNMAGRGKVEPRDVTIHPRVLTLDASNRWVAAADPIHFDKTIAGVCLGTTFGKTMAARTPNVTIGLIPCAVGGTRISRWQKDAEPTPPWGHLYRNAVDRAGIALRDGVLKGILWHQGEGDSSAGAIDAYRGRLTRMISDLQRDLEIEDVPVVAGELGVWDERKHAGRAAFNANLAGLPNWISPAAVASSEGTHHGGDGTHFDSASLRELGRRYAEAMLKLQTATE